MFASQNLRTSATLSNWKSLLEQRKSLHGGFGSDTLRRDMAEDLQAEAGEVRGVNRQQEQQTRRAARLNTSLHVQAAQLNSCSTHKI